MVCASEGDDPNDINHTTTRFKPMAREYFTLTNNNDVHRSTRNNPAGSQVYTLNGDDKAWGSDGPDVMWGGDGKDALYQTASPPKSGATTSKAAFTAL